MNMLRATAPVVDTSSVWPGPMYDACFPAERGVLGRLWFCGVACEVYLHSGRGGGARDISCIMFSRSAMSGSESSSYHCFYCVRGLYGHKLSLLCEMVFVCGA